MGNSSSRQSEDALSNPQQHVWVDDDSKFLRVDQPAAGLFRSISSSSGKGASSSTLSVPSTHKHRRSRSANATQTHGALDSPPPYCEEPAEYHDSRPPAKSNREAGKTQTRRDVRSVTYLKTPMRKQTTEDALETLKKYDTLILVDDSSSMREKDHRVEPPISRWEEAKAVLMGLAEKAGKYDTDGIDIYFLNADDTRTELEGRNMTKPEDVRVLFERVRPMGITPLGKRLDDLLRDYMERIDAARLVSREALKAVKPINIIVITDGAPTDDPESVIVNYARTLEKQKLSLTQVGIQFVQIGASRRAKRFLQELDDNLAKDHDVWDIVDTTPYMGTLTPDALIKILLGGINRRLDKQHLQLNGKVQKAR